MSKPQRRKGNVHAASSAHAAALLEKTGQPLGFVGFDNGFSNVFQAATAARAGALGREIDSDIILIFRKLSKKDPQTREKALRELITVLKEKDAEMVELCYNQYANIMDKLTLDGSPTVRTLSLRAASSFISTLKKSAEKQLKVIMPFVFIGTCDSSLSVANQAEAVLSENFPGEKTQQATSIFAVATASVAVSIIAEKHGLVQAQKYDCEDSPEQRVSRLTTQCLLTLARLAPIASSNPRFTEILGNLFKDSAVIKKLVKSNASVGVKSALLGVCLQMPDCVSVFLNTPLATWIISSLDSADSAIATRAFEAFLRLGSDERFFEKFNVEKAVIPKILSVVRKKEVHWRHVSSFFLPSYALLLPRVDDQLRFALSFIESFMDKLPFETGGLMQFWAKSFAECLKYTFSKGDLIEQQCTRNKLIELAVQGMEIVSSDSHECQEAVVALVLWTLEKNILPEMDTAFLLDSLQLNLMNKRPTSDSLLALLVAGASWWLRTIHVALLRVPPLHPNFVAPLLTCTDDYLSYIDKNVDVISLLSKEVQVSSDYARAVLRILRCNSSRYKDLNLPTAKFTPFLLLEVSPDDWPHISEALGSELIPCLRKVILEWGKTVDVQSAKKVLEKLEVPQRGELMSVVLENDFSSYYASELVRSLEIPLELTADFSRMLFQSIFFKDVTDDELDSVLKTLAIYPPCDVLVSSILTSYLEEVTEKEIPRRCTSEKLQRIGMICSQLLYSDHRYISILPTQEDLLLMLRICDLIVEGDVIAKYGLFSDPKSDILEVDTPKSEGQLLHFMENIARKAAILLNTDCEDKAHNVSLAFAAVVVPVVNILYDTRWQCEHRSEVFAYCSKLWEDTFQRTALATRRAITAIVHLPEAPASAQLTLRILTEDGAALPAFKEQDAIMAWYWAASRDCSGMKLEPVERWISRFHAETPLEFLAHIYEYIQRNAPEWQEVMFSASSFDTPLWRLSALCMRAAISVFGDISLISTLPAELLDFIMCGVVTAFDSCDEAMSNAEHEITSRLETLAGLALNMFTKCAEKSQDNFCNSLDTEWPNFFLPTMARIIVRWFTLLTLDDKPTFFVRSLTNALLCLKELPDDLMLKKKLCPELDRFGYDAMHQTLIIQVEDLVVSECPFIRFASLHMLKLMAAIMYRQENEQWIEEEKVSATGPRHLVVPDTLSRLMDEATGWPAIIAFDAALVPLTINASDEERVAYCDALPHAVSTVLPQILARCPEDIPSTKEREYFISDRFPFSFNVYERYAANLLYRTLGNLPAVVRNWYAGLPNSGTQIVSKYVRYYVSKLLIEAELNKVKMANKSHLKADKSLKIRVVPVSGEVVAEYTVEETTMRLSIVMPSDWPLSVPSIQIDKAIVPSEKVKKWLLQLTAYLFHQNGSTVEGIIMWRKNVDRDVEGAEACTICMMTIHSTNHQLPKVKCRQCKNKFHSNCLYKWFESSSQSSCPLCRANFT